MTTGERAVSGTAEYDIGRKDLIAGLQSLLDRMAKDSYAGTVFEADGDTLREAIKKLRADSTRLHLKDCSGIATHEILKCAEAERDVLKAENEKMRDACVAALAGVNGTDALLNEASAEIAKAEAESNAWRLATTYSTPSDYLTGLNEAQVKYRELEALTERQRDEIAQLRGRLEAMKGPDRWVTVCDQCKRASCWRGTFMCDKARTAGTIDLPLPKLRELNLEHASYWQRDEDVR